MGRHLKKSLPLKAGRGLYTEPVFVGQLERPGVNMGLYGEGGDPTSGERREGGDFPLRRVCNPQVAHVHCFTLFTYNPRLSSAILNPYSTGTVFETSESDVYGRQTRTPKVILRAEKNKILKWP